MKKASKDIDAYRQRLKERFAEVKNPDIETIKRIYRESWDELEAQTREEIGEVTMEEAFEADSYLSKLYDKQEDELDDRLIRALEKLVRERDKNGQ